jgi:hypothetical protein
VPVAYNSDGSTITGSVYEHIANAGGSTTRMPYQPFSLDTTKSQFTSVAYANHGRRLTQSRV